MNAYMSYQLQGVLHINTFQNHMWHPLIKSLEVKIFRVTPEGPPAFLLNRCPMSPFCLLHIQERRSNNAWCSHIQFICIVTVSQEQCAYQSERNAANSHLTSLCVLNLSSRLNKTVLLALQYSRLELNPTITTKHLTIGLKTLLP